METVPTTTRDDAGTASTDIARAVAVFNDATCLADSDLSSKSADSNNQQNHPSLGTRWRRAFIWPSAT